MRRTTATSRRRVDPEIVACSFIASGLRVFDISDPTHPKEIAYFVAPTKGNTETGYTASDYAMSKPAFAPERREIWYTDGGSGFYVLRLDASLWPPSDPTGRGCPMATGRLGGDSLGAVSLGMTRAQARRAFVLSSTGGRRDMDFLCLSPIGIRVGYPSVDLLRTLSASERQRVQGRVVLALTANRFYALRGVHPGARLAAVARRLGVGPGIHVGLNWWYLAPKGSSRAVLKVRHGVVLEIGIANEHLTQGSSAALRFLKSLLLTR